MQPQRIKSQAEIDQEKRDEDLARQLAMEDEQAQRAAQQAAPRAQQPQMQQQQQQQQGGGQVVRQVTCGNCIATNNVPPGPAGQEFACGACGRTIKAQSNTEAGWGGVSMHNTMGEGQNIPVRTQPLPRTGTQSVTCQTCRALNQIPTGSGATQFMCGGCGRVLGFNQNAHTPTPHPTQVAPPSAPIGGPSSGTTPIGTDAMPPQGNHYQQPPQQGGGNQVLQGQPANQQVQVRCYQCQTVNAVSRVPGQQLQFMCGSCKILNKV